MKNIPEPDELIFKTTRECQERINAFAWDNDCNTPNDETAEIELRAAHCSFLFVIPKEICVDTVRLHHKLLAREAIGLQKSVSIRRRAENDVGKSVHIGEIAPHYKKRHALEKLRTEESRDIFGG